MKPEGLRAEVGEELKRLASLPRAPGSAGEHEAAEFLCSAFRARGLNAQVEPERVHGTYWWPLAATGALAAAAGLRGRVSAAAGGALAALEAAEDLELGPRLLRRVLGTRTAHNVLATAGAPGARHTLVIHAHHDAAHTGLVFHPAAAKLAARYAGGLIERAGGTPAPMWSALAGPLTVAAGGLLGRRRVRRAGTLVSLGFLAAMLDIARRPAVPGANDNLSGVCVLLSLAAELARRPPENLRVILLSTGSEESFLEAMERFGERHFPELPPERTTFLCLESVGSPQLMLLGGEGVSQAIPLPE